MRLFRPLRLLCAVLLPLSGHAAVVVQSDQKVAFLGDSITAQGWEQPGGYVKLVVAGLAVEGVAVTPVPAGVSGNTSREMLQRLDHDVLKQQPAWMTLSCGVNDVWHGASGVDLEGYKKNMTEIVERAQAQGVKVILVTPTVITEDLTAAENGKLAAYIEWERGYAKEKGLPLADPSAAYQTLLQEVPLPAGGRLLTVDGVHPNPAGHLILARSILKAMGVPDEEMPKIEAAWDALPGSGLLRIGTKASFASIPLGQYHVLEKIAASKRITVSALANRLFLDSFRDVLQAHQGDATPDLDQIQDETRRRFEAAAKAATVPAS